MVEALDIQPELGGCTEEMGEAQGRVAGDGASAVHYLGNVIGGNLEPASQFRGAHLELVKFFGQVLAGMDWDYGHNGRSLRNFSMQGVVRRGVILS